MTEQPQCPRHRCSRLVPAGTTKSGKPYKAFYSCELQSCTEGKNGKPWTQDAEDIPAPGVSNNGMPAAPALNPRLTAAIAALQAAATHSSGTGISAEAVLNEAASYYQWLKQTITGDIPAPLPSEERF